MVIMGNIKHQRLTFFLAFAILLTGSVATKSRRPIATKAGASDSLRLLRSDLDKIFLSRDFAGSQWRVEVFSLGRSEKLYERESTQLCIPASTNKLITVSAALLRLGADYQFKTRVLADGRIADGVLQGNLIIVGSGDPSNSPRFQSGDPFGMFRSWGQKLKEKGVQAISGDIVGDGEAFEENPFGQGWEWNDLTQGYAAPVSALQFNENLIAIHITPGLTKGSIAFIEASPLKDYLNIDNNILTDGENSAAKIRIQRSGDNELLALRGSVPLKVVEINRDVSVQFPIRYYLSALRYALREDGIDVSKAGIRETRKFDSPSSSEILIHISPALSEIIKPLLKESLNLWAETLARTLGLEQQKEGSFSKGREVIEETLSEMGVEKESYSYADASGLSRHNLVSADILVRVLKFMYGRPCFQFFYEALPIAGYDGTLENRMKGTAAENNAHAKTGTLSNVSAISGYVRTRDGEMLAFAMIANNFLLSKSRAESAQDAAIVRLANFSRK
jgi:serine-type D-Ala-D-Ala carboxypeptidase/endopeptidase (penicillin-binding protein 4)